MKNIKLKYVCGNVIEMGNYWRFEQGQISVSADTFYQIIHNLNISFEEFTFYHNGFKHDKLDDWGKTMIHAFQTKNKDQLDLISINAKTEFNNTQQIRYLHLHYLANIYKELINKNTIDPTWISQLKQYLTDCDQWGYYKVTLFNNILFCFSDLDTILVLYKRMNQSYLRSKGLHKIPNEEIMLAINIICLCIIEKSYSSANEINQMIQIKDIDERSMFARTLLLWCDGLVNKVVFRKDEGLEQIKTSLEIMKALDMETTLNMFDRWTNQLLFKQDFTNKILL